LSLSPEEQAALVLMPPLRAEGVSQHQIAAALDDRGFRPRRASQWHSHSVGRIPARFDAEGQAPKRHRPKRRRQWLHRCVVRCVWGCVGRDAWEVTAQRASPGQALWGGLAWIAKDLGARISPDADYWDCNSSYDYALNAVDTLAFLFVVPTIISLFRGYRASTDAKIGLVGPVSAAGFGVGGIANLLEHCAGMTALGLAYVVGVLLAFILLLIFASALTRVHVTPTSVSWLIVVGTAAGLLLGNQGGLILFGIAWVVLAYASRRVPRRFQHA
jgi:hypothetical protein